MSTPYVRRIVPGLTLTAVYDADLDLWYRVLQWADGPAFNLPGIYLDRPSVVAAVDRFHCF